ncbi:hypothetical protein OEA41_001200 [Lepraria neglecta]|uniref:AB hydrolase-1 domain-containing protein n=1 Tax=Lepraria neglecta TaxID=209136 RepID=A0AAD9ZIF1_9LECA|nr:hypothetical protein OEA41_001200 [Lepraria neglecta]
MFPTFTPQTISTSTSPTVKIHTLSAGTGPPLLLLHGFPQSLNIWHLVTPSLTSQYTVILLDLRGYGKSSKPEGGEGHKEYSKSAMAADCVAVMTHLGYEKFYICAHDRGARVAHKLCVEYPERVMKAMFLDTCPTLAMYNKTDFAFASAYWHWFFLIQKAPLPEILMVTSPRSWIENTMGGRYGVGIEVFDKEALQSYVEQMGDEETVHGMCEDYRAAASIDLEEQKKDVEQGRKIKCPLRVLWGKSGVIEKQFDALAEWRKVSEGVVDGETVDCGHYIPEEVPEVLLKHIKEFLRD